jgi:cytochrome c553
MHGIPALAGQNALYFKQTMEAYASGARANDVYSVMRSIAKELTPEEIEELAEYYAGLE